MTAAVYNIGERGRTLKAKISEQKQAIRPSDDKNGIAMPTRRITTLIGLTDLKTQY